uniref:hypothetical protein n=1 Tax=Bordetella pertussis TaxID=520 RepID=UPI00374EA74C
MQAALTAAREQGGQVSGGERLLAERYPDAWYVRPASSKCRARPTWSATRPSPPILYVMRYGDLPAALAMHNGVPQGLFVRHLHQRPARSRGVPVVRRVGLRHRQREPSAPRARRSAARRKPAAAASPARTPGSTICGAPPTPSITRARCPWRKASGSASNRL